MIWRVAGIAAALIAVRVLIYAVLARVHLDEALCQWDCGWYLSIVRQGYDPAPHLVGNLWQANWAFFPLFPLLVRGAAWLSGLEPRLAGMAVSTLACFVFAVLGARYRQITRNEAMPWLWLLLIVAWPFGFYFHAVYTEALYAALATAALLALAEGRPLAAGVATAFLTATRPTGILLAAWIGFGGLRRGRTLHALLPAAIAPLGLLAYMAFLYVHVGDPLAFQHIQAGWQRAASNPLAVLADTLATFDPAQPRLGPFYLVGWAMLGLAAAVWLAVTRRFAEAWLCGMTLMMALGSGSIASVPRFVVTNPAFLFAAADLLGRVRWRWLRGAILAGLAVMQVALVLQWFRGASFLQ